MIKAYALNKNGKIELTPEELQKILEEAEAEGRRLAQQPTIVYRQCPYQTNPTTIMSAWGDTHTVAIPCTCQTTAKEAGKMDVGISDSADTKSARETIDEIKSRFGLKAE